MVPRFELSGWSRGALELKVAKDSPGCEGELGAADFCGPGRLHDRATRKSPNGTRLRFDIGMNAESARCRAGRQRVEPAAGASAGGGDVRPRRRYVVHERVDLRRGHGSPHDRERRPVGDRPRGLGLRCLHPHQLEDGRSHGPKARLRDRPARLRHWCAGHDAHAEPDHSHHLLGDHRRPRRLALVAGHAVAHPRQLHGSRPEEGLRPGRCLSGDRRCRWPAPRRIRHHLSVVARRFRPRGRHHRGGVVPDPPRQGRAVHGTAQDRPRGCGPLGRRHGRRRPRHPGLAGGWWLRRPHHCHRRRGPGRVRLLARPAQAQREAHPVGP